MLDHMLTKIKYVVHSLVKTTMPSKNCSKFIFYNIFLLYQFIFTKYFSIIHRINVTV